MCLVKYHQGLSRRQAGPHVANSSHQGGTEPDWYVPPDGHQSNAWKLLHAARKGSNRFCVGSGPRYAFRQAGDAANRTFESLLKIYFCEAWWKIELNQPESPLRLPRSQVCCKMVATGSTCQSVRTMSLTHRTQESAICASRRPAAESENAPPSEAPEPATSQGHPTEFPTSPITIGSTEEERVDFQYMQRSLLKKRRRWRPSPGTQRERSGLRPLPHVKMQRINGIPGGCKNGSERWSREQCIKMRLERPEKLTDKVRRSPHDRSTVTCLGKHPACPFITHKQLALYANPVWPTCLYRKVLFL